MRSTLPAGCLLAVLCTGAAAPAGPEGVSPISNPEKLPSGTCTERWVGASQTAAVIYWQTENRARSFVEFGRTEACEKRTPLSEASTVTGLPHWTQCHRLTGLSPGRRYHYRTVCVGTDERAVRGEVRTFETPKARAAAIRVPDDLKGPPYVLDRKGATYVMTKDLSLPLGGIEIRADGVTLDMDGHTLTYNDRPADRPVQWNKRAYVGQPHDFGVNVSATGHARILHGRIVQGRGNTAGTQVGIGCNPIYARSATVELAGVEFVWAGKDISGVFLHWKAGSVIHHCVFDDRGSGITNRHQALSSVDGNAGGRYHHNLVRRTRQQGLVKAARAEHNEIYVDSRATNAFGITGWAGAGGPVEIAHNRILGVGEHPVGIGMFQAFRPGTAVHHNLVEVKCTRSGAEYGYTGSACFRTTWGTDNLAVHDNTFIAHADVYGGKVAKARAVWVGLPKFTPKGAAGPVEDARAVFRDNYVAALGRKGAKAGGLCVVCMNESPNLIFTGNTVVSTWGNVLLGDGYGHAGGYAKFVGNTFRRVGTSRDYYTVRHEYAGRPGTGVFLGNVYEDGASADSVRLQTGGRIVRQRLVEVAVKGPAGKPLAGAEVVVRRGEGATVWQGRTRATETEAALVVGGLAGLSVSASAERGARGYVAPVAVGAGVATVVLGETEWMPTGKATPWAYTVTVTKPGHTPVTRPLTPPYPERLDVVLKPGAKP